MRVIGAGLGRTGTYSLKLALERLLGGRCYHMAEVFERLEEDVPVWHAATRGDMPDWHRFFAGYSAAVDLPTCLFWPELTEVFPEATVVLSTRDSRSWWESARSTIYRVEGWSPTPQLVPWLEMISELHQRRFHGDITDGEGCMTAFERHNDAVRNGVDPTRLVEWHPREGWGPICLALGLPIPDEPFPNVNTREDFLFDSDSVKSARRRTSLSDQVSLS